MVPVERVPRQMVVLVVMVEQLWSVISQIILQELYQSQVARVVQVERVMAMA